jgi:hypothetical protein
LNSSFSNWNCDKPCSSINFMILRISARSTEVVSRLIERWLWGDYDEFTGMGNTEGAPPSPAATPDPLAFGLCKASLFRQPLYSRSVRTGIPTPLRNPKPSVASRARIERCLLYHPKGW